MGEENLVPQRTLTGGSQKTIEFAPFSKRRKKVLSAKKLTPFSVAEEGEGANS